MNLSTLFFVFAFLPVSLILYLVCPRVCKNALLVLISFVFYAWGSPVYLLLLLLVTVFNYCVGLDIGNCAELGRRGTKSPSCDRRAVQSAASRLLQIRRICHRNAQRHFAVHAERAVCGASARHFLLHLPEPVVSFGRLPPSRARAEKSAGFLPLCSAFSRK